ncbi:DUF309 domain-containing protein [Shimia sp.]|uniref:DUF309 domain-containing protein n=1 Tax=Shimia sp. TaxID=1954381 RepID=UPI003297AA5E
MTVAPDWRPPHVYVPGETARHDAGLFDRFGFSLDDIEASERWRLAHAFIQEGYFWEAHELLEPIWMGLPPGSRERALVQGLIQLANAGLKRRMGRENAVARLAEMARELLFVEGTEEEAVILGISRSDVSRLWNSVFGSQ